MNLPVDKIIPDLLAALEISGTAVLVAPPGSGKTTVVPLHLMTGAPGKVLVLEPRRVATRAAARRMASSLGQEVGHTVGYVTRDERRSGASTKIEVVTEGVLTRRLQRDPTLEGTAIVVFDEFHERNLQTDLGLALTMDVRRSLRPDLKILVMSATLDADRVAHHLEAPIIRADGHVHPVEVRWVPPGKNLRPAGHTAAVIRRALAVDAGDILVFLPGMGEILEAAHHLEGVDAEIHKLHGSLSAADQDAALFPSSRRKVILSTDIAESSLTVEGVQVVVDTGLARSPRFDARTGMTRLTVVSISRASADQRLGRAGRLGPGVAYRLWSKIEHGTRRLQIDPEISQVDLAGFLLELAEWGETDPAKLPFLDPPPPRAMEEAARLLTNLGAIQADGRLTEVGRKMAALPLHPRLAAMVARAGPDTRLACVVAAVLEDRDILRGRDLPTDVSLRAAIVAGFGEHPAVDSRAVARARRSADDLARRMGNREEVIDPSHAGRLLAIAFPDRLAVRRGSAGRFQLRGGSTAFCDAEDHLAGEAFLIATDLDGKRKDARIRLAAALAVEDVAEVFADDVTTTERLEWNDRRLVIASEERIGGVVLRRRDLAPSPGEATIKAILDRLRKDGISGLSWTPACERFRNRITYLSHTLGSPFPDLSDATLASDLSWLAPWLGNATSLADVAAIDLTAVFRSMVGSHRGTLDSHAPERLTLPNGRTVKLDYSGDVPVLAARVQDLFGLRTTPLVGGQPVVVHLLSPAGRPVQITRDLEGFWEGSWHQVRKEMAARYPKHAWPEHPVISPRPPRR